MRIAAQLYRRFEALVHELSKFGTVGAIGFVMNYGITNLLYIGLHWGPLTSNVIATCVTVTFAYFANRFWTFRHREQSGLTREYFLFFVFNGIGLLIQILCVGFTAYTLKLTGPLAYNAALTVGVVGGTMFRYWSYKKWVFLPPTLPPVDPHTGLPEAPAQTADAPDGVRAAAPAGTGDTPNGTAPNGAAAESTAAGTKAGTRANGARTSGAAPKGTGTNGSRTNGSRAHGAKASGTKPITRAR